MKRRLSALSSPKAQALPPVDDTPWGSLRRLRGRIEDLKANIFDSFGCASRFNGLRGVAAACFEKRRNWIDQALEPSSLPRRRRRWLMLSEHAAIRDIVSGTLNWIVGYMQYDGIHLWPKLPDRECKLKRRGYAVVLEVATVNGAFRRTPWIVAPKRPIG